MHEVGRAGLRIGREGDREREKGREGARERGRERGERERGRAGVNQLSPVCANPGKQSL